MKSLLKVCSPAYSLTMQGFRIIPESITCQPRALHTPSQREKFTDTPPSHEWSTVPLLYIYIYVTRVPLLLPTKVSAKMQVSLRERPSFECYYDLKAIYARGATLTPNFNSSRVYAFHHYYFYSFVFWLLSQLLIWKTAFINLKRHLLWWGIKSFYAYLQKQIPIV